MIQKDTILRQKNAEFLCENCNFICSKKSDYDRHISTVKHHNRRKMIQKDTILRQKTPKNAENYTCDCGKIYKHHSGLWRHKKTCIDNEYKNSIIQNTDENHIVNFLMKENSEFKQLLIEQNKQLIDLSNKIGNTVFNTINNSNSNNKTFNLNMFLNETCKNAMNLSDFANSIQLQLTDLESVGELGYVNGISNIIIKNLKELDITQRPIHCTDAKRETLYIKDKDKWEKEGEQKELIIKFVNNIASKNIRMLNEFKKKYPDCCKYESKYSDYYSKLIIEAMGGSGGTNEDKNDKIIKKITREVIIDKNVVL
jgi:hypothetical protein